MESQTKTRQSRDDQGYLTLFTLGVGFWKEALGGRLGHPIFLKNGASERVGIDWFVMEKIQRKITKIPNPLRGLKKFDPHRNFFFGKFWKKNSTKKIVYLSKYTKKFRKNTDSNALIRFWLRQFFPCQKFEKLKKNWPNTGGGLIRPSPKNRLQGHPEKVGTD